VEARFCRGISGCGTQTLRLAAAREIAAQLRLRLKRTHVAHGAACVRAWLAALVGRQWLGVCMRVCPTSRDEATFGLEERRGVQVRANGNRPDVGVGSL
jgi:hypothetical protein